MYTRNTITNSDEFVAELRRVRERGYAFDRGETSLQAACVGAPILDARGTAVAALSISGPTSRFNPRANSPVIESLLIAVREVGRHFQPQPSDTPAQDGAAGPAAKRSAKAQ